jgi:phospholipid transport system substrate-binding protein
MTMRTLFLSLALVVASISLAPLASAQEGPATRYVRQRQDEVMRLLRRDTTTDAARRERNGEVTRVLSELLDYQELSRRALATHWDGLTEAQRTQFVDLLRQLVERQYQRNLQNILDFEVRYAAEDTNAAGTTVHTEARSRAERRQPPVLIDYSMHLGGGHWRVFDVNTDGVSLVRNYQRQFHTIISQHGWDELVRRMQQRLAAAE